MSFVKDLEQIELFAQKFWSENEKKYLQKCHDVKYKYEITSIKFLMCEFAYHLGMKRHFFNKGYIKDKKEIDFMKKIIEIAVNELE